MTSNPEEQAFKINEVLFTVADWQVRDVSDPNIHELLGRGGQGESSVNFPPTGRIVIDRQPRSFSRRKYRAAKMVAIRAIRRDNNFSNSNRPTTLSSLQMEHYNRMEIFPGFARVPNPLLGQTYFHCIGGMK